MMSKPARGPHSKGNAMNNELINAIHHVMTAALTINTEGTAYVFVSYAGHVDWLEIEALPTTTQFQGEPRQPLLSSETLERCIRIELDRPAAVQKLLAAEKQIYALRDTAPTESDAVAQERQRLVERLAEIDAEMAE